MPLHKKITVIGLGTFGEELCLKLEAAGAHVTVLDTDPAVVQAFRDKVHHIGVADGRDPDALRQFEVEKSDLVFVGTRDRLEMTILILLALHDIDVPRVAVLVSSKESERALKMIGRSWGDRLRIIFPERDIAQREAQFILNPSLSNYLELAEGFDFVEISVPEPFVGRDLMSLDIRARFGVNVVAVRESQRPDARLIAPTPTYEFDEDDSLLVIGPTDQIRKLGEMRS